MVRIPKIINQLMLHFHYENSHVALTIILVLFTILLILLVGPITQGPIIHMDEYRNLFWYHTVTWPFLFKVQA